MSPAALHDASTVVFSQPSPWVILNETFPLGPTTLQLAGSCGKPVSLQFHT